MPQPVTMTYVAPEAPLVCPRCNVGTLKLHVRFIMVGSTRFLTTSFISCSRKKHCGWNQTLTGDERP